MKKTYIIFLFILTLTIQFAVGQTATITIGDYEENPGTVLIPVDVTNFIDVGAITLFIEYDDNVLVFNSVSNTPLAGVSTNTVPVTGGTRLGISWFDTAPINYVGPFELFELEFTYLGGSSPFDLKETLSEIADSDAIPIPTVYFDGSISPDLTAVPIDIVDQLDVDPGTLGGSIDMAIEVDFSNVATPASNPGVGSFNFEIEYDPTYLTFQSLVDIDLFFQPSLTVNVLTGPPRIAIAWNASTSPSQLNGILCKMRFAYTGGSTELNFIPSAGAIADYDADPLNPLYSDGIITQDPTTGPNIIIGDVSALAGTTILVPVTAENFTSYVPDFGAFDFSIGFNPAQLQFVSLQNINTNINSGIYYNAISGELNIAWNASSAGVTFLDAGELMFNLEFTYSGTTQPVFFKTENCSMANWDTSPIIGFYFDGEVTEIPGAVTVCMDTIVSPISSEVLMPVFVTGFDDIGAITLEVQFDNLLLNYVGIDTENPLLTTFGASIYSGGGGLFTYSWTVLGSAIEGVDIPDDQVLFYIKFFYNTGPAPVLFNTPICEIANFDAESLPVTYCDGLVRSGIEVDLTVFLEGLYNPSTDQMNKAQDYVGGVFVDKYAGTVADVIDVELHGSTYGAPIYTLTDLELNQDGTVSFEVPEIYTGSYWITIKNRNHLETVSGNFISFASGNVVHDFTTAASQAYGSNQIELETGIFGIYAGDVLQDGVININDAGPINSAVLSGNVGYIVTDIDGNAIMNINDAGIVNVHVLEFIQKITP